ncbi:MAG TPA: hypothetical protein VM031_00015 [Phycisphaerae bacterium]|nr:hypothetical protein [Phycisphaerae bacterium]
MNRAAGNLRWIAWTMTLVLGAAWPASAEDSLRERDGKPVEGDGRFRWRHGKLLIEWGFRQGAGKLAFDGTIASTHRFGVVGTARPLPGDERTTMTGDRAWKSPPSGTSRRGIVVPVLYTDALRGPARTIVTVRTSAGSFSFQPVDLRCGPILAPEYGFFIRDLSPKRPKPAASRPSSVRPALDMLKAKLSAIGGAAAVGGWGSTETPLVYANPAAKPFVSLGGAITVPPRSVAMHPAPHRDVAVGWRSPIAGKVAVRAKVADAHRSGGNGVGWSIVRDARSGRKVLLRGAVDRGGSQTIPPAAGAAKLAAVSVQPGDVLSLVVDARGSHTCDSTAIELTVAEVGGKRRAWNLAKDVVDDIQAANPHADSLGNAAVWHFHAPRRAPGRGDFPAPPLTIASKATTAREYLAELAAGKLKTIRQRVRQRPEQTWVGAMRAMHGDRAWPAFPKVPYEPSMSVDVPCPHLTALWRIGAWQIIKRCPRIRRADLKKVGTSGDVGGCKRVDPKDPEGIYVVRDNPFPPLGCETDRILWALDHMGMHDVARDGLDVWLENQQADGSLSLNSGMERAHKFGALHLPWVLAEHYRLTGDTAWLKKRLPRLKATADWIIRRRRTTMKDKLSKAEIDGIKAGTWSPYGLQPRITMGDGDPSGSRYFYVADASAYRSLALLAEVIAEVDPRAGKELAAEVQRYRKDILRVVEESLVLSPVIKTRDGTFRSFLPQGFQDRGALAFALPETANIFSHCGPYSCDIVASSASIEAWLRSGLLSVDDPRIDGHFDVLEDVFLRDNPWVRKRTKPYDPEKQWFGNGGFGYQSGWERLSDYYLARDDVPNFLRAWLNRCAVDMNLANWTFNEHTTFAQNDKSHGNAGFLSNFRNMLVMEIGQTLWLARATPRAWLGQGGKIRVQRAPTHFGTVSYEIVSHAGDGRITATIEMPARKPPKAVLLRFRHPRALPIKSATVNGRPWTRFDKDKETLRLPHMPGTVRVEARY